MSTSLNCHPVINITNLCEGTTVVGWKDLSRTVCISSSTVLCTIGITVLSLSISFGRRRGPVAPKTVNRPTRPVSCPTTHGSTVCHDDSGPILGGRGRGNRVTSGGGNLRTSVSSLRTTPIVSYLRLTSPTVRTTTSSLDHRSSTPTRHTSEMMNTRTPSPPRTSTVIWPVSGTDTPPSWDTGGLLHLFQDPLRGSFRLPEPGVPLQLVVEPVLLTDLGLKIRPV